MLYILLYVYSTLLYIYFATYFARKWPTDESARVHACVWCAYFPKAIHRSTMNTEHDDKPWQ